MDASSETNSSYNSERRRELVQQPRVQTGGEQPPVGQGLFNLSIHPSHHSLLMRFLYSSEQNIKLFFLEVNFSSFSPSPAPY